MQRRMVSRIFVLSLLLCGAAVHAVSQDQPRTVFTSQSEVVVVHVTVTDGKSQLVAGLPQESFAIFEDGQPQTVSFFHNQDHPVTVGLVLDSSGSMQRKRDAVIAAGMAFARSSHPEDEMFTVNFNERVWNGLPASVPFTTDTSQLQAALEQSTARGQTALFDGVRTALKHLADGHEQKKVLILISDGGDNASTSTFNDVLDMALRMDAVIYAIGMYDQYDRDAKPDVLRKLAKATGGVAYFPHAAEDATKILEEIARDIRSGYTLGYVPSDSRSGYRAIRVEVHSPDNRKLSVRARAGYVAGPATSDARK